MVGPVDQPNSPPCPVTLHTYARLTSLLALPSSAAAATHIHALRRVRPPPCLPHPNPPAPLPIRIHVLSINRWKQSSWLHAPSSLGPRSSTPRRPWLRSRQTRHRSGGAPSAVAAARSGWAARPRATGTTGPPPSPSSLPSLILAGSSTFAAADPRSSSGDTIARYMWLVACNIDGDSTSYNYDGRNNGSTSNYNFQGVQLL
ncbi:hypothetical protein EJB05_08951, partial [Eragrostis curvula]